MRSRQEYVEGLKDGRVSLYVGVRRYAWAYLWYAYVRLGPHGII